MSQREATINRCDICTHEWIPKAGVVYTHCTSGKCRSRKWNSGVAQSADRSPHKLDGEGSTSSSATKASDKVLAPQSAPVDVGPIFSKPVEIPRIKTDMQALRNICSGNMEVWPETGTPMLGIQREPNHEIPICGKSWWEDSQHYECLMDKGHKNVKHGQGGMVRRLEE